MEEILLQAQRAIEEAEAVFIGTGAGMGVDSGLPDFRGNEGFWKAYPVFKDLGYSFVEMANPRWFDQDPELAWGFYGHRLELYRQTQPHLGFQYLLEWIQKKDLKAFIYTSNVDGHFQRAGFSSDQVLECHGSIHHLQCSLPCRVSIWENDQGLSIDKSSCRLTSSIPKCRHCGRTARPNILMFGDGRWLGDRTEAQEHQFSQWRDQVEGLRVVVIEIGAGTHVPTVRYQSEIVAHQFRSPFIRINPRESEGPPGTLGLAMGGLQAIELLIQT